MPLSATALRATLYKVLDQILATGVPVEIVRKGKKLKIVPEETPVAPETWTVRPDYIRGDPDELIHVEWGDTWTP